MIQPLPTRILSVLRLGYPLSAPQLTTMLWAHPKAVERALRRLLREQRIMRDGQRKGRQGPPVRLWALSWAERVPVSFVKTLIDQEK